MKTKIDDVEYEVEIILPDDFGFNKQLYDKMIQIWMTDWIKSVNEENLKIKRELRIKKLNKINDENKKDNDCF